MRAREYNPAPYMFVESDDDRQARSNERDAQYH